MAKQPYLVVTRVRGKLIAHFQDELRRATTTELIETRQLSLSRSLIWYSFKLYIPKEKCRKFYSNVILINIYNIYIFIPIIIQLNLFSFAFSSQVPRAVICSFITYHRSLPTQIWPPPFCPLAMSYRPKCLSINRQVYQNALVSFHLIIRNRHRWPSRPWTAFRWARSDSRCNWRSPRMHRSLTRARKERERIIERDREKFLNSQQQHHQLHQQNQQQPTTSAGWRW